MSTKIRLGWQGRRRAQLSPSGGQSKASQKVPTRFGPMDEVVILAKVCVCVCAWVRVHACELYVMCEHTYACVCEHVCALSVVWVGGAMVEWRKCVQETIGGYLAVKVKRKMGDGCVWIRAEGKILF